MTDKINIIFQCKDKKTFEDLEKKVKQLTTFCEINGFGDAIATYTRENMIDITPDRHSKIKRILFNSHDIQAYMFSPDRAFFRINECDYNIKYNPTQESKKSKKLK